jgi:DNA-directed RNA polymerase specialized sigma24 family protein
MEEIAEILGVSEGTVKSRLHRAKQKAANLLEGRDIHG